MYHRLISLQYAISFNISEISSNFSYIWDITRWIRCWMKHKGFCGLWKSSCILNNIEMLSWFNNLLSDFIHAKISCLCCVSLSWEQRSSPQFTLYLFNMALLFIYQYVFILYYLSQEIFAQEVRAAHIFVAHLRNLLKYSSNLPEKVSNYDLCQSLWNHYLRILALLCSHILSYYIMAFLQS